MAARLPPARRDARGRHTSWNETSTVGRAQIGQHAQVGALTCQPRAHVDPLYVQAALLISVHTSRDLQNPFRAGSVSDGHYISRPVAHTSGSNHEWFPLLRPHPGIRSKGHALCTFFWWLACFGK